MVQRHAFAVAGTFAHAPDPDNRSSVSCPNTRGGWHSAKLDLFVSVGQTPQTATFTSISPTRSANRKTRRAGSLGQRYNDRALDGWNLVAQERSGWGSALDLVKGAWSVH